MEQIPARLYSAEASRRLDQIAIQEHKIPGYSLMEKAGKAVFDIVQQRYALARRILVCCGAGNNAGDGYVVARLARQAGLDVDVVSMIDPEHLKGDALQAYRDWKAQGIHVRRFEPALLDENDLLIDALLGTGLQRPVEGQWLELIEQVNAHRIPVVAVDVPSGLNADTGSIMGAAMEATLTLSFIAMKKGLVTHDAVDICGELLFDDLGLPAEVYDDVHPDASLLNWSSLKYQLKARPRNSHKGDFGHVLVVGGDYGMAGAACLAGEAALRAGAGRVSVATRAEHVSALLAVRPELMVSAVDQHLPEALMAKADCIVIGPGLGRDDWGSRLLGQVLQSHCPKVLDADALNLLSAEDGPRDDWVLTPHPGEAARLLEATTAGIQGNRYTAVEMLQEMYGGSVLLKGAGSIVQSAAARPGVCPYGNPGMASAGMGDLLSGMIGALIAQGLGMAEALELATVMHALAGDRAAADGERGLLASDLFAPLRALLNADSAMASD